MTSPRPISSPSSSSWCDALTRHPVLRKGVTNMRTINMLTYIILNNYLENINLQKYCIYIHHSGIYSVMYSESHLLVLLGSHYLQNLTFTFTKSIQTLPVMDSYSCVGPAVCGISRTSSSIPTRINTRAKLHSLVGIHKYRRPL